MKKYFAPAGDYILYILTPPFVVMLAWLLFSVNKVSTNYTYIILACIPFFVVWLFIFLRRLSYYIILQDDELLIEKGFFCPNRNLNVANIIIIKRAKPTHWGAWGSGAMVSSREFYFVVNDSTFRNFPYLSVTPKIVDAILQINPKIKVANNMAELVSDETRKRLGLHLSVVEWIWRFIRKSTAVIALLILIAVIYHWLASLI